MSASIIMPAVRKMLENEGVYITGSVEYPEVTVIMVSQGGKIFSTMLDKELGLDGFGDGFIVKSGPHK